jgi:hypothetical protein
MMTGTLKRRLLSLERNAEVKRSELMEQIQYDVFEAMHLSYEDRQHMHVICARSDPLKNCTPEERAVLERFSAELETAFKLVSDGRRL